jgi:transcriptional regulator with XRE-family HTH domain
MKKTDRAGIRRRAGLTQLRLSRLAKVSPPRISLWENGEIQLRPEELERIAAVLANCLSSTPVVIDKEVLVKTLATT